MTDEAEPLTDGELAQADGWAINLLEHRLLATIDADRKRIAELERRSPMTDEDHLEQIRLDLRSKSWSAEAGVLACERLLATIDADRKRINRLRGDLFGGDMALSDAYDRKDARIAELEAEVEEQAENFEVALRDLDDVRTRLGGLPESALTGENGLAAATMREIKRLEAEVERLKTAAYDVAYEAHTRGRIYTKGGEKGTPADVARELSEYVTRVLAR
jgi:hypothetical protein